MKRHNWMMMETEGFAWSYKCADCYTVDTAEAKSFSVSRIRKQIARIKRRTDCDTIITQKAVKRLT